MLEPATMRDLEIVPCPQLAPYVRLFWLLELDDPADFGPPTRITPDGVLELVFHYRTPFASRYAGCDFTPQPSVAVSQTRRYLEILPRGAAGLISVRFQPWGAYHFFRPPLAELADLEMPTELLWGRDTRELEERLAEAAGDGERVALVEAFLLEQLGRHHKADVEPVVRAIWQRQGRVAIAGLCRHLGVGERRLQRTFHRAAGHLFDPAPVAFGHGEVDQVVLVGDRSHHDAPRPGGGGLFADPQLDRTRAGVAQQTERVVVAGQRLTVDLEQVVALRDACADLGQRRAVVVLLVVAGEDVRDAVAATGLVELETGAEEPGFRARRDLEIAA